MNRLALALVQTAVGFALLPVLCFMLTALALAELAQRNGYRSTRAAVRYLDRSYAALTSAIIRNLKATI